MNCSRKIGKYIFCMHRAQRGKDLLYKIARYIEYLCLMEKYFIKFFLALTSGSQSNLGPLHPPSHHITRSP